MQKNSNGRATIKQELPRFKLSFGSALRHAGPQGAPTSLNGCSIGSITSRSPTRSLLFPYQLENTLTPTAVAPRDTDDPRIGEVQLRTGMSPSRRSILGGWGIRQAEVNYKPGQLLKIARRRTNFDRQTSHESSRGAARVLAPSTAPVDVSLANVGD